MARAVGIDLGTTNSVVSVLEGGEATVVANAEGARTTPSVVAFSKSGEVLVGEVAKRQAVTNIDRTIRSVKRHMGTDWSTKVDDKSFNAQQISAFILQKLSATPSPTSARTSPTRSSPCRRTSPTPSARPPRRPVRSRGSTCCRIVNEPTAAALAYGLDKGKDRRDSSWSSTSVAAPSTSPCSRWARTPRTASSTIQVRATSGDNKLGGDDWDQRKVVEHLADQDGEEHHRCRPGEGQDRHAAAAATRRSRPRRSCPPRASTNVLAAVPHPWVRTARSILDENHHPRASSSR